MRQEDAIGVVRKHRWAPISAQRQRLEEDGCRVIVDLDSTPRDWLYAAIREGTVIKAAYAMLLTPSSFGAVRGLAFFKTFSAALAKLPRGCFGYVKDLETGLIADTPGTRKAMLAIVKDQLARSGKGRRSAENGKRGRVPLALTKLQDAEGKGIWLDRRRFPEWKDAETELRAQVHKDLTRWQAHRRWGPREVGAKTTKR